MDFARERLRFPTLLERTYFASQCFGPYPREMLDDLDAYRRSLALRSRAIGAWSERWVEIHALAERLVDAPPGSVFLRDSATAVCAAIAASLRPQGERRRIVISSGDFHSIRYLWAAQARRGFDLVTVPANGPAHALAETFTPHVDERTSVVCLSLVSPRTGALLDVRPVVETAKRVGAIVVLDAYQAIGVVPLRVREIGADVVVGGFHKWVGGGGTGLSFGYVDPELSAQLDNPFPGWMAHADLLGFCEEFVPARTAEKFQQGMPPMEPIYTSRAGIHWVLGVGVEAIRARSLELTGRILERANERGLIVRTPVEPSRRGGTICMDVPAGDALVAALAEQGIDIDVRPGAGIRVGPHACSTEDECDRVVDAIAARLR